MSCLCREPAGFARAEQFLVLSQTDIVLESPPSRGRGLKRAGQPRPGQGRPVAPFAGARIETICHWYSVTPSVVAPFAGARIETISLGRGRSGTTSPMRCCMLIPPISGYQRVPEDRARFPSPFRATAQWLRSISPSTHRSFRPAYATPQRGSMADDVAVLILSDDDPCGRCPWVVLRTLRAATSAGRSRCGRTHRHRA